MNECSYCKVITKKTIKKMAYTYTTNDVTTSVYIHVCADCERKNWQEAMAGFKRDSRDSDE